MQTTGLFSESLLVFRRQLLICGLQHHTDLNYAVRRECLSILANFYLENGQIGNVTVFPKLAEVQDIIARYSEDPDPRVREVSAIIYEI